MLNFFVAYYGNCCFFFLNIGDSLELDFVATIVFIMEESWNTGVINYVSLNLILGLFSRLSID